MRKRLKTPTVVTTAVLTLITVIFWIGFEIFRAFTVHPSPPVPQEVIKPLNPALDLTSLNKLQQRQELTDEQIGNTTVTTSTTPAPTTVPLASPSATLAPGVATPSATPVATVSGTPKP